MARHVNGIAPLDGGDIEKTSGVGGMAWHGGGEVTEAAEAGSITAA